MKPAYLMSPQERIDYLELQKENAAYLTSMNRKIAESYRKRNPERAATYQKLSDGWRKEFERLVPIVKRAYPSR